MIANKHMNRKAQIGKLISAFPIMLLIFIIMGIFVLLSSTYSITKSKDVLKIAPLISTPSGDLLDRVINLGGPVTIRQALIDFCKEYFEAEGFNEKKFNELSNALQNFVMFDGRVGAAGDSKCLVIYGQQYRIRENLYSLPFITRNYNDGSFVLFAREIGGLTPPANRYEKELVASRKIFQITPKDSWEFYYYYWGCGDGS